MLNGQPIEGGGTLNGILNGILNGTLNGTLNEKQQEVLNFIKNNPYVKAWEITSNLGIPRDTLNKIILKQEQEKELQDKEKKEEQTEENI